MTAKLQYRLGGMPPRQVYVMGQKASAPAEMSVNELEAMLEEKKKAAVLQELVTMQQSTAKAVAIAKIDEVVQKSAARKNAKAEAPYMIRLIASQSPSPVRSSPRVFLMM